MSQFQQICISRIDRIGDLIISTPAIKAIRSNWPNSKITLLASSINSKVLKNSKLIDEIIIIKHEDSLIKKIKILRTIQKRKYDLFINFSPTNLSYFLCLFSFANKKGVIIYLSRYKKYFSKLFHRLILQLTCDYVDIINRQLLFKTKKDMHQSQMMLNLIEKISKKSFRDIEIQIPVNSVLEGKIKNVFTKKIITIHLSRRWINKYYNINNFNELINKLLQKNQYVFFLTTEKENDENFIEITKKFRPLELNGLNEENTKNLKTTNNNVFILDNYKYSDWISVIKQSKHIITPESGCTHIAAAFKVPVTVIYNSDNAPDYIHKEYGPWKSIHHKLIFSDSCNINDEINNHLD